MIIADAKGEETEEEGRGKLSTAIAKRRGEERRKTNKQEIMDMGERASERASDSGITTKGPFFLQKRKKNLRYVDYLLYFMYLLIYL